MQQSGPGRGVFFARRAGVVEGWRASRDVAALLLAGAAVSFLIRGITPVGLGFVGGAVVALIGYLVGRSRPAAGRILDVAAGLLAILVVALSGYGPEAPALVALPLAIVIAYALGGARVGFVATAISIGMLGLLFLAEQRGVAFPVSVTDGKHARVYLVAVGATTLLLALFLHRQELAWTEVDARLLRQMADLSRTNTELEQARDEAQRASQAKSMFLASMSHELRTPLNAILGYTELILEDDELDREEMEVDLTRIKGSAIHLLALVSDVLDMAKVEAEVLEVETRSVDLHELASRTLDDLRPVARESGTDLSLTPLEGAVALADPARVRQILHNLLVNALRHAVGGTVRVELSREQDQLALRVIDDGEGMDEATRLRCFLAFEKGERSVGGTGLGLAISHRLARLMGGDLTVQSAVGEGACFTLILPSGDDGEQPA